MLIFDHEDWSRDCILTPCFSVAGCVSPGGKCASSPCPAGYECADFSQGYQCKCVDSSKCDLDKPGCEDMSCVTGMYYLLFGSVGCACHDLLVFAEVYFSNGLFNSI